MEEIKLDVQIRSETGSSKVNRMRRSDLIPAVVYGGTRKPTIVKIDRRTFERIHRQHEGESVVFHLNVLEGEKKLRDYSAIIKEEQHDPVSDRITHVDFKRISLKKELEVKVPVAAKGNPVGVTRDGGSLDHVIWELDVVCLPTNIPQHIDVDVSQLEIGESIHVGDITLPSGVKTRHDPESILFTVAPPMREEETEPKEDEDAEPEVIKQKKPEDAEKEEPSEESEEQKKEEK